MTSEAIKQVPQPANQPVGMPPSFAPSETEEPENSEAKLAISEVQPTLLVAGELVVEIDKAAGRFVSRLFDPVTHELTRQYPSDAQLAFSRALNSYLDRLRG